MTVIFVVLPLGVLLGALALAAFLWGLSRGQFDDLETPGVRVLWDDEPVSEEPPSEPPAV